MYHAHWGLRESPFSANLNPQYYFASPTHDEALARMHFLVEQRRRFGLLLGPAGTGKSLLFEVFDRELKRQGTAVAKVSLLGVDTHELIWLLSAELGINPSIRAKTFALWRGLVDRIVENRYQRVSTVMLLDDIDEAEPELLHTVTRLYQCDVSPDGRLTILSAGLPEHIDRLGQRLLQMVELRTDLETWEEADTAAFLESAVAVAGRPAPAFSREAAVRIHSVSGGVPRDVSRLADLALAAGAGNSLDCIDADTIESVSEELSVTQAVGPQ